MILKCILKKWFVYTLIIMFCVIMALKGFSLKVHASDFSDTFYYGDVKSSYAKIETSGRTVYEYPQGTLIFLFNLWDKQYVAICCPRYNLVNNGSNLWGLYRHTSVYNNSGALTSYNLYDFYQMEGYSSDNFHTINGVEYIIRTMEMSTVIEGLPYFFVWSNRTEGPNQILESYINGAKSYMEGVTIGDINASIDTSNLEQLISDGNTTSSSILSDTSGILSKMNEPSSGDGLTTDDRNLLKHMDMYIVLIFFVVGLLLFRNVLHQIGRNIRGVMK